MCMVVNHSSHNNSKRIQDPLEFLLTKYGFHNRMIEAIVSGEKYTAVMINDGSIGVCANLGHQVDPLLDHYKFIELDDIASRIVLNAYFNALFNQGNGVPDGKDIFDSVDFYRYCEIVMLGCFRPVIKKLNQAGIAIKVFDFLQNEENTIPEHKKTEVLSRADAVILTSTSVFNLTFSESIQAVNRDCDVFLLGPSSILSDDFFMYPNIRCVFGTAFNPFDRRVLNCIRNNGGTKDFQKFGKKVTLAPKTVERRLPNSY